MHSVPWKALVLSLASVSVAPAALALSVIPPSFEDLVAESELVIDAEVTGSRSELSQYQGRPLVYTYVTLRVLDAVKGAPGATVELRILGGTVGEFTLEVSGVPTFEAGDRNLFFIAGNGSAFCPLVAVPHGYYPIRKRVSDGAEVVLRSNGAPLVAVPDVSSELGRRSAGATGTAARERALTLAGFKKAIREEVAGARTQ